MIVLAARNALRHLGETGGEAHVPLEGQVAECSDILEPYELDWRVLLCRGADVYVHEGNLLERIQLFDEVEESADAGCLE